VHICVPRAPKIRGKRPTLIPFYFAAMPKNHPMEIHAVRNILVRLHKNFYVVSVFENEEFINIKERKPAHVFGISIKEIKKDGYLVTSLGPMGEGDERIVS
jgi:hypothetical protein